MTKGLTGYRMMMNPLQNTIAFVKNPKQNNLLFTAHFEIALTPFLRQTNFQHHHTDCFVKLSIKLSKLFN